jgi:ABC-type multidrug transport system permease subunit
VQILLTDLAIVGAIVGICQWQLLKCFRVAGLWLFASVFALLMSGLGLYLGYMLKSVALASVLQGTIYGAITGLAVIKILRSPKIFPKKSKTK